MDGGQDLGRRDALVQFAVQSEQGFCRALRMRLLVVDG